MVNAEIKIGCEKHFFFLDICIFIIDYGHILNSITFVIFVTGNSVISC